MIAALATLAFLAAAWLAIVAMARTLEDGASRIAAALRGRPLQTPVPAVALRVNQRCPVQRPRRVRAQPALRAAA